MQTIENYIGELNKEFVEVVGGSFVSAKTGEIFTSTEVQKYVKRKIEEYNVKYLEDVKRKSMKAFDLIPEQNLINKRSTEKHNKRINQKQRYDGGDFNMVYRNSLKGVMKMKLENNERLVYYTLRDFINYPTNSIMINDEIPKIEDLESIVGLKERTIRKSLKSLEEKELFKLVQSGHRKAIFVNPVYYASGKEINIETLHMFDLVECDDNKVEDYLED